MYCDHNPEGSEYRNVGMERTLIGMQDNRNLDCDSMICDEAIFDVESFTGQGDYENKRPQEGMFGRSLPSNFTYSDEARRRGLAYSKPLEIPNRPAPTIRATSSPNTASSFNESMFSFKATSLEEMAEKQRRRKESHNAVERRRRDHINEMILRLSRLVSHGNEVNLNKGEVLERAANRIDQSNRIIEDLVSRLKELGDDWRPLEYERFIVGSEFQKGIDPRQFY